MAPIHSYQGIRGYTSPQIVLAIAEMNWPDCQPRQITSLKESESQYEHKRHYASNWQAQ